MDGGRPQPHKGLALLAVAGFVLLLAARSPGQQQPSVPLQPPPQPLPYSHKAHLALGLQCANCHRNADPGEFMGFPAEAFCMGCHQAIKADSPHIAKLSAAANEKKPIPWIRIYQLPRFVYFSHRRHTTAGVSCETCHGPVRERDVITSEVAYNMRSCMACHAASKARNDCSTCHEER